MSYTEKDIDLNSYCKTLLNEYYNSKIKLEKYQDQKTRAFIFTSKVRWYEHGEKNNRYFYNLVKRNYCRKHITELENDNKVKITNENEILNFQQQKRFYEDLYSSSQQHDLEDLPSVFFLAKTIYRNWMPRNKETVKN